MDLLEGILNNHAAYEVEARRILDDLAGLGGRYQGMAAVSADATGENPERYAVHLRLDNPKGADQHRGVGVSGDVFDRIAPNLPEPGRFVLGGRADWQYSFYGTLRYRIPAASKAEPLRLAGICTLSDHRNPRDTASNQRGLVSVEIAPNSKRVTGASFLRFTDEKLGLFQLYNWRVDTLAGPEPYRRVGMHYAFTKDLAEKNKDLVATIKKLFDRANALSVHHTMEQAGIALEAREHADAGAKTNDFWLANSDDPEGGEDFRDLAHAVYANRIEGVDWQCFVLFGDGFGSQGNGQSKRRDPYGVSYGLNEPSTRFQSRYGMVVNATDVAGRGATAPVEDAEDKVLFALRHTTMHEFGHLLNMPHAWERHLGHPLLGPGRSDTLAWSNYAMRHPLGRIAEAAISSLPTDTEAEKAAKADLIANRERTYFEAFGAAIEQGRGFDDAERRFIRHAPLDHIAQGGRTFLDYQIAPPRILPPENARTGDTQQRLQIVASDEGGADRALARIRLWKWRFVHAGNVIELPRLPGAVVLSERVNGAWEQRVIDPDWADTGRLQLFVHQFHGRGDDLPPPQRKTRALTPDLADNQRQTPFPWLRYTAMERLFGAAPVRYAVQAVLYESSPIRSNIVRVDFSRSRNHAITNPNDIDDRSDPSAFDPARDTPISALDMDGQEFVAVVRPDDAVPAAAE